MESIVWLASYPKSGNTWVRIFLANYLSATDSPIDINALADLPIASSRTIFDDLAGVDSADLTSQELLSYRPDVYRLWSAEVTAPSFVKVHDAQIRNAEGQWLFPSEATRGAIYIIRNPLDVAVSFAAHAGVSIDQIVARMCSSEYSMSASSGRFNEQLPQRLMSWSQHVESWVETSGLPCLIVRYEDLLSGSSNQFRAMVAFAGLELDEGRLQSAVRHSSFGVLRAQEATCGFNERNPKSSEPFFRRGRSGSWQEALSPEQIGRLVEAHGVMMRRFGYLDADNQLASNTKPR